MIISLRSVLKVLVAPLTLPALAMSPAMAADAPANPAAGKLIYMRCVACHSIEKGGANKVGPNLSGIVGRKAGAVPNFRYSAAMTKARLTWDEATLDKWLARPMAVVPGTSMAFVGLSKPQDRANVIAYMKKPGR